MEADTNFAPRLYVFQMDYTPYTIGTICRTGQDVQDMVRMDFAG